ncbi:MAG: hypothetical protein P4M07_25335 [Xanthobacteraceae bacterium]|nr:hypothetical protein [Xanthobacteraceae bacterium]
MPTSDDRSRSVIRTSRLMQPIVIRGLAICVAALTWAPAAHAHGIAGNRYFDGTMTFDDPAVADEATVPNVSHLGYPTRGSGVVENRINWAFARLLTPTLGLTLDSGWIHQTWPNGRTSGFDRTNLGLKYEAWRDNRHETLVSVSLAWGIAHSGAQGVGTDAPNTVQPGIFFGKGFGDLPEALSWLRPFAVTGSVVDEIPAATGGRAVAPGPVTGAFETMASPFVETLHWGFSIQYSTLYLTSRYTGGAPRDEPLNQWVPLVEFRFDSPRGQATVATANPGLAYVAVTWQVAAEAIVPINRAGGNGPGFRAQLLLFLDDMVPSVFGKPLLTGPAPERRQIAW